MMCIRWTHIFAYPYCINHVTQYYDRPYVMKRDCWGWLASGMLQCLVWYKLTKVLEVASATIIKASKISKRKEVWRNLTNVVAGRPVQVLKKQFNCCTVPEIGNYSNIYKNIWNIFPEYHMCTSYSNYAVCVTGFSLLLQTACIYLLYFTLKVYNVHLNTQCNCDTLSYIYSTFVYWSVMVIWGIAVLKCLMLWMMCSVCKVKTVFL